MLRWLRDWLERLRRPPQSSALRAFGNRGERAAEAYLTARGYKILARQHRTAMGEVDLIAFIDQTVVFVEVKTRESTAAGHPVEAVDRRKQAQLTRLALAWLKRHKWLERRARFDVVAILWPATGEPQITHYINAFEPTGEGQMFS